MSRGYSAAAVGMFDGVHRGHRFILDQLIHAAGERNLRSEVYTFSRHPLAILDPEKEPARLSTNACRRHLISEAGIDRTVELDFGSVRAMNAAGFMQKLHDAGVRVLIMGFNNHIGSDRLDADAASACGIMEIIRVVPYDSISHISSTAIRKVLAEGKTGTAAGMLGRAYSVEGIVTSGKHLGRTIGFPTANISTDPRLQLPAQGVYAVDIRTGNDACIRRGMANIGRRPTVDEPEAPLTLEVNIFDFDKDIYGQSAEVCFLARLRPEKKFSSTGELAAALAADRLRALSIKNYSD